MNEKHQKRNYSSNLDEIILKIPGRDEIEYISFSDRDLYAKIEDIFSNPRKYEEKIDNILIWYLSSLIDLSSISKKITKTHLIDLSSISKETPKTYESEGLLEKKGIRFLVKFKVKDIYEVSRYEVYKILSILNSYRNFVIKDKKGEFYVFFPYPILSISYLLLLDEFIYRKPQDYQEVLHFNTIEGFPILYYFISKVPKEQLEEFYKFIYKRSLRIINDYGYYGKIYKEIIEFLLDTELEAIYDEKREIFRKKFIRKY